MPCIEERIPGGFRIACTRGSRYRERCSVCPKPHTALCDWPMPMGGTCDVRLCERHRARQGGDVDLCPDHAKLAAAQGVRS